MTVKLTFLGAVGTVTGSKYLVEVPGHRLLVDCGLFQGFKQLRLRNWAPLPVDPASIDAVLLTHAHIDHSGYLPLLVKNGFTGPVYATEATRDLCGILLPDSGHLQEKDAEFANRHGFSKHRPALPLYTRSDATAALENFRTVAFDKPRSLAAGLELRFLRAGHILGAAILELGVAGMKLVFSGDLGRYGSATMLDPSPVAEADHLVVESTYGDRRHEPVDPEARLADAINRASGRSGTVLIPAFAVGRAQALLYHLHRLKRSRRIPDLPVFLDSPMAIDASDVGRAHPADHKLGAAEYRTACAVARYVQDVAESKALDADTTPKVIISASGMATGGRVLHHLKRYAPDPRSIILFAGYQAGGTRGASLVGGAESVKIHGEYVRVRAEVANLDMLSAHADVEEIMRWLGNFRRPPGTCFITHGEPAASDALRRRIEETLGWRCVVPEYRDTVSFS
jgi:metallo-beta-lactamase family protein